MKNAGVINNIKDGSVRALGLFLLSHWHRLLRHLNKMKTSLIIVSSSSAFSEMKGQHICCQKRPLRVKLGLSQVTPFIASHVLELWGLKRCPADITSLQQQRPYFHAGAQHRPLPCTGKFKSSLGTVQFFPSPTPVWYFGDSLFTEAGGDDNGLLLIPCWAGAPCTPGHKNIKSTRPHPVWVTFSVLRLIKAISQIFFIDTSKWLWLDKQQQQMIQQLWHYFFALILRSFIRIMTYINSNIVYPKYLYPMESSLNWCAQPDTDNHGRLIGRWIECFTVD